MLRTRSKIRMWPAGFVLSLILLIIGESYGSIMLWTDPGAGRIQRANQDGSSVSDLLTTLSNPRVLAIDHGSSHLYWTDTSDAKIRRSNLDGTNVIDVLTSTTGPHGLALDLINNHIYWSEGGNSIWRSNLDGSDPMDILTGLNGVFRIALDTTNDHIYYSEDTVRLIRRANLDGSNVVDITSTGTSNALGLALDIDSQQLYWSTQTGGSNSGKIVRVDFDGSDSTVIITGLTSPRGIALDIDNAQVYWADPQSKKIQKGNLDGTGVTDLVTGLSSPRTVALQLNGTVVPAPDPSAIPEPSTIVIWLLLGLMGFVYSVKFDNTLRRIMAVR